MTIDSEASAFAAHFNASMTGRCAVTSLGIGQRLVVNLEIGAELPNTVGTSYDVAITIRNSNDFSDTSTRMINLAPGQYLVCAASAFVARRGRFESPKAWRFRSPESERVIGIKGNFEESDRIVLQDAARDGSGIARLRDCAIAEDLVAGTLVVLFDALVSFRDGIAAAVASGQQSARVRRCIDVLTSCGPIPTYKAALLPLASTAAETDERRALTSAVNLANVGCSCGWGGRASL